MSSVVLARVQGPNRAVRASYSELWFRKDVCQKLLLPLYDYYMYDQTVQYLD